MKESPSQYSVGVVLGIGVLLTCSTLFLKYQEPVVAPALERSQEAVVMDSANSAVLPKEETVSATSTLASEVVALPEEVKWREWFPQTVVYTLGGVTVEASIAKTTVERMAGLSNTPYLPAGVVKLFVFQQPGEHAIWMKDMLYPIDIFWLDEAGSVIHVEENVHPDTYPQSFSSPVPAWYVVEAVAGFAAAHGIGIGATSTIPVGLF